MVLICGNCSRTGKNSTKLSPFSLDAIKIVELEKSYEEKTVDAFRSDATRGLKRMAETNVKFHPREYSHSPAGARKSGVGPSQEQKRRR